jgi:DNA-binding HxlR family transcriptional regulator
MVVDDTCPVSRTAEIVCGKWTLLLVRELAEGCSRFCELERSLAGISPRTLSLRLRVLEEESIVERQTFPEVPPRVEYALTGKGRALLPIIEDMREYGEDLARPAVRRGPSRAARTRSHWPSRTARSPAPSRSGRALREVSARCVQDSSKRRSRSSSGRHPRTCAPR